MLLAAQSTIDIALYDLAGKAWGVPVYQLLGGKQSDFVPGFATASGDTADTFRVAALTTTAGSGLVLTLSRTT